jgi:hypothetical protein
VPPSSRILQVIVSCVGIAAGAEWWPEGWPEDSIIGLIVDVYATVLLVIMSPFLIWYLLSWLVCLAVTPFRVGGSVDAGASDPVIAYWDDNQRAEWRGSTAGSPPTSWYAGSRAKWRGTAYPGR